MAWPADIWGGISYSAKCAWGYLLLSHNQKVFEDASTERYTNLKADLKAVKDEMASVEAKSDERTAVLHKKIDANQRTLQGELGRIYTAIVNVASGSVPDSADGD